MAARKPKAGAAEKAPAQEGRGGRSTLALDKKLIRAICGFLAEGGTDRDAAELAGISTAVFYKWIASGKFWKEHDRESAVAVPNGLLTTEPGISLSIEFMEGVTRARAKARRRAIQALKFGAEGGTSKRVVTKVFTETRQTRDGKGTWEYRREELINESTLHAPDWRAGVEYLKRRDRDNWTERIDSMAVDFETEIVKRIKIGAVDYAGLMDEFKDKALVMSWFERAGVIPQEDEPAE